MRPRDVARDLWLSNVPVEVIAQQTGMSPLTIRSWRVRDQWPARKTVYGAQYGKANSSLVKMAAKCWQDGIPRLEIAVLCQISRGTLDHWRQRYGWGKRKPGVRPGTRMDIHRTALERQQRFQLFRQEKAQEEAARARQAEEAVQKLFRHRKWRCCDQLRDTPTCGTCGRRWSICA